MMTGQQFTEWRHRMGFTKKDAARRLSVGINTPKDWEDGKVPIPEAVDLLCSAIALNVRPYSEFQPKGDDTNG